MRDALVGIFNVYAHPSLGEFVFLKVLQPELVRVLLDENENHGAILSNYLHHTIVIVTLISHLLEIGQVQQWTLLHQHVPRSPSHLLHSICSQN